MRAIVIATFFSFLFVACKSGEKKNNTDKAEGLPELTFSVLSEGDNGGFETDTLFLYLTKKQFEEGWKKLHSNYVDHPPLPEVDFSSTMVVVLAMGERNKGGYHLEATKLLEKPNQLALYVNYISPAENCILAEVMTYPYLVISIPKRDKLVAVSKNQLIRECK